MKNELLELKKQFQSVPHLEVDLRGEGKAEFLYVRSIKHAVEISVDGGRLFVEYWDETNDESDKSPIKSEITPSSSEAWKKVMEWL